MRVEPDGKPDDKGLIKWDLVLKPREEKAFRIEYRIEYPSELLQRQRAQAQPGAPAAAEDALMMQIDAAEKMF